MTTLAYELGFDWNVPPVQGIRSGVYPLQLALVKDGPVKFDNGSVISPFSPTSVRESNKLLFRLYDFTDPKFPPPGGSPEPSALQVLFSSAEKPPAQDVSPTPPFSPIDDAQGREVAQLAATSFHPLGSPPPSIAYKGVATAGWRVEWSQDPKDTLERIGRFNFRALLTVTVPGEMARFYRADPEMVIGEDQAPAPTKTK